MRIAAVVLAWASVIAAIVGGVIGAWIVDPSVGAIALLAPPLAVAAMFMTVICMESGR